MDSKNSSSSSLSSASSNPINAEVIDPLDLFDVEECVGRGNFGDVYRAVEKKTNKVVAVKVVNLEETDDDIDVLVQEISFLSQLKSKYITNYFETYLKDTNMWIIMEYCGGGSCADLLKCHKRLDEEIVCFIIRETLRGLEYLHLERKIHRDIKSANILLTSDGLVKLADFGVSGQITATNIKKDTFVGTPFWMAPEVITRKSGYNEKADIWSLGITTIELITGSPPYSDHEPMKILFEIPKKPAPLLSGSQYSYQIKEFIKFCLVKNPSTRPSASILLKTKFIRNCKRHINLIPLIEQKDEWFRYHRPNARKPKYKLSENIYNKDGGNSNKLSDPTFKWNFTARSLKLQDFKHVGSSNSPTDEHNSSSPGTATDHYCDSSETDLTSPEMLIDDILTESKEFVEEQQKQDTAIIYEHSDDIEVEEVEDVEQAEEEKEENDSKSISYFNDVMLFSLSRVYTRAKTGDTKTAVRHLFNELTKAEREQPGLCEALSEEIWQRMCQLKEQNKLI